MVASYKPKLYLETTIFNFYSYGKAQEKQISTRALFERIEAGEYELYTSSYALDEMEKAYKAHYKEMYALIPLFDIKTLPKSKEAEWLADMYMANRIIPLKYPGDARQVALAAVEGFDCVVSWNMGHLVKQKTMIGTGFINKREGYPQICLATPKEIMEYDATKT